MRGAYPFLICPGGTRNGRTHARTSPHLMDLKEISASLAIILPLRMNALHRAPAKRACDAPTRPSRVLRKCRTGTAAFIGALIMFPAIQAVGHSTPSFPSLFTADGSRCLRIAGRIYCCNAPDGVFSGYGGNQGGGNGRSWRLKTQMVPLSIFPYTGLQKTLHQ